MLQVCTACRGGPHPRHQGEGRAPGVNWAAAQVTCGGRAEPRQPAAGGQPGHAASADALLRPAHQTQTAPTDHTNSVEGAQGRSIATLYSINCFLVCRNPPESNAHAQGREYEGTHRMRRGRQDAVGRRSLASLASCFMEQDTCAPQGRAPVLPAPLPLHPCCPGQSQRQVTGPPATKAWALRWPSRLVWPLASAL